jgi:hypothetical protein
MKGVQGIPQMGPQGAMGPFGVIGHTGFQGMTGLIGPQGSVGLKGVTGPQGYFGAGPIGAQGYIGDATAPDALLFETGSTTPVLTLDVPNANVTAGPTLQKLIYSRMYNLVRCAVSFQITIGTMGSTQAVIKVPLPIPIVGTFASANDAFGVSQPDYFAETGSYSEAKVGDSYGLITVYYPSTLVQTFNITQSLIYNRTP